MDLIPKVKSKLLFCKNCGKRIGLVKPKLAFNIKLIVIILGISLVFEIIAQIFAEWLIG